MEASRSWKPERLSEARVRAGFPSQRKLAQASGVDQQTISNIEAGATMSTETAKKLSEHLQLERNALYIAHNVSITAYELARGNLSLRQAKKSRNYIERVMENCPELPPQQYIACRLTLDKLTEQITALYDLRVQHVTDWPGAEELVNEATGDNAWDQDDVKSVLETLKSGEFVHNIGQ